MTSLDGLSHVRLEGDVLRIAIATADNGTSLDFDGVSQGTTALQAVTAGTLAARSVLLIGEGANFCAGGNVRAFAAAENRGEFVDYLARTLHDFVRAIDATEIPVVAAVQGWAAGAGMSLVCASDVSIGGPSTKLRPAYPSIGYTPTAACPGRCRGSSGSPRPARSCSPTRSSAVTRRCGSAS
ncbi:enoyl-CoA hydratase/isomerase family protein [Rhodococcus sp. MTM3W5.2]|nr:enoyl-CoA hydratase/isomerase family protein [Rhodococcus sp. MTM3W5.2]